LQLLSINANREKNNEEFAKENNCYIGMAMNKHVVGIPIRIFLSGVNK
jgi:hypothetical protein